MFKEFIMMKFAKIFLVLLFIFSFYGCATESKEVAKGAIRTTSELTEEQAYCIGVKAYVYGYPLVLMDVTRKASVQRSGMNNFAHAPVFRTAAYRLVVRSNVDTLYSGAWLALSREPMVLSVPDTGGRYYVMQMRDGWTETFALLGKRTTGTQAGHFVIVGPDWQGPLPSNSEVIKAPTNVACITGRIQTNGAADYSNVHAIQRGYRLTPLSAWPRQAPPTPPAPVAPTVDSKLPPPAQVARMDAATFFTAFAALLKENRPHPEDTPLVAEIKTIGLEPGKPFNINQFGQGVVRGINRAIQDA